GQVNCTFSKTLLKSGTLRVHRTLPLELASIHKELSLVGEITIKELRKKLEIVQKEKDGIQLNVDKFKLASKSLNKLIECQIVDNYKKGLGYENYNVVPLPYTRDFMPPTPDLSFTGLDEFVNEPVVDNCKAMSSEEEPKGNQQMDLQFQGVIDSGYSRHMTWNMSYLIDYKEIDGGYVAFGGNPKGGKITGKCAIKIDYLGKFDGKYDEGFFVGYSLNSKAFKVFNSRTRIVAKNLHIRFSASIPNVIGSIPDWLFDIDALTRTMNYEPIITDLKSSHYNGSKPSSDDGKKVDKDPIKESECNDHAMEHNVNSTNNVNIVGNVNNVSSTVNAIGTNEVNVVDEAVHEELGDSLVRAATTASSLEAVQDSDEEITLVNVQDDVDKEMFNVNVLDDDEVFVAEQEVIEDVNDRVNVVEEVVKVFNTAKLIIDDAQVSAVGDIVSTASIPVSAASAAMTVSAAIITISTITIFGDITLAQALEKLKSTKPKEKGIDIQELGKSTPTKSLQQSQDKGKGILIEPVIEPVKPMKRKDQIRLDKKAALKLQAAFNEEERLVREKAKKVEETNIALIET
nr:hypothetical protein [Tanacetum cinerariifolium]